MAREGQEIRPIARNKKARHEFLILEELECGIVLVGTEVKSLRAGRCSLQEAFAMFRGDELYLVGMTIPEYSHGNIHNHPTARERKLLAHRRQLYTWHKQVKESGVTCVPLEIFFRGHLVKVQMALVRGKKLYDKRETQKQKSAQREMDRAMSRRRREG